MNAGSELELADVAQHPHKDFKAANERLAACRSSDSNLENRELSV
jgi:hypothetical protein